MIVQNRFPFNISLGILVLRIFIGARLFYGVIDNILYWDKITEFSEFLQNFGFPYPLGSALMSVALQFMASISIILGYKIRCFAFLMVINFIIAIVFVHLAIKDTVESMTPAFAMLFTCTAFIFMGAGKYSLDYYFEKPISHRGI